VPTFRDDLDAIPTYSPGKPIDEVSRELGISDIVKLASNESPVPPFPPVIEAIAVAGAESNRYPENSGYYLVAALADRYELTPDHFWLGAGSSQLINCTAAAVGGPGTEALYADPSFVMYPISTAIAGAGSIAVPLDSEMRHDLVAMKAAITETTTIVYVCNPNNPTGTYVDGSTVREFVESVPDNILVVVDEAYHEYVTAPDHETMLPLAATRPNVLVMRTFSKVYGLAGLRIGYGIGRPETLGALKRAQIPFSANVVAQAAALEALKHDDLVAERAKENAMGRERIETGLAARGIEHWPSQTNFVMFRPALDPAALSDGLLHRGVIVRPMGPFIRVSVGTDDENERFLSAVDVVLS
jgi:histidinol-phosphate aminotransferase